MARTCPVCNACFSDALASCPSCGYKMPDCTQSFAPISLDSPNMASRNLLDEAMLTVVRGEQVGTVYWLSSDSTTIGRSPNCEIFLNDMTVSRQHAHIMRANEGYTLVDDDSFNGVWVNNVNVHEKLLQEGDVIQIGTFCLVFQSKPRA